MSVYRTIGPLVWYTYSPFTNELRHEKTCLRDFQKMARGSKFRILEVEVFYYLAQLICAFVFTYAKSRLFHAVFLTAMPERLLADVL